MIRIALLDPHPVVQKGFKAFFRKTEHIIVIETFSKSKELYLFLKKNKIDALVLEMELACESVTQIIKNIKLKYPKTFIIIFTSLPQSTFGLSPLKAGAAGYLSKEVGRKIMIEAIEKVVDNNYHITTNFPNEMNNNNVLTKPCNEDKILSPRETQVLKLLTEGKRNTEISKVLNISQKTVNTYKTRLMIKLQVQNLVDLFQQARNFDLI